MCKRFLGCISRFQSVGLVLMIALAAQLFMSPAFVTAADSGPNYFRIEEDWVLVILDPDSGRAAPQVATEMSPTGDTSYFCNFEVNHHRLPEFTTGGLQVQIWQNENNISYKSYGSAVFSQPGEAMTWTQYMERGGSTLKFGISQGVSLPWGTLKEAWLHVNCADGSNSLAGYRSEYSALRSAITYGANRVKSLKLVQVRKYRVDSVLGQVLCDIEMAPRTIWEASSLN